MAHGVPTRAVASCTLAVCLPLASPVAAFPQAPADAQTSADSLSIASSRPAVVAYVYVGTTNGTYLYDAAPNGSVSVVGGSPRATEGVAVGSNEKYFVSLDPTYLHAYAETSDGEIKSQSAFVNTQSLSGSQCGTAKSAVYSHNGQKIYVQLSPDGPVGSNDEACSAIQTYAITQYGGLNFLGASEFATETESGLNTSNTTPIKLSGSGAYAYSASYDHGCDVRTWELKRDSAGVLLSDASQYLTVPATPSGWGWETWAMTSDPTNHMAVAMIGTSGDRGPCPDERHPAQLASFTVASDGSLSSTNMADALPTPLVSPEVLNMSPAGRFLAVGGSTGLQVFHFNGPNPITPYGGVLTTAPISQIGWDHNNHLYALSDTTNKLYVYTITLTAMSAVPGSPFVIPATPNALAVVPVECKAPSADGVNLCAPAPSTAAFVAPLLVLSNAKISGTFARTELWIDGVKKLTTNSPQLNMKIDLPDGRHVIGVFAINTAGQKWKQSAIANVFHQ